MKGEKMTKEQKCIAELYRLLLIIEDGARRHDFSLLRIPRGASGCDMYQGLPPISRAMNDILDRHEDVINATVREIIQEDSEYFLQGKKIRREN